jgi:hypothetical protein
MNARQLITVTIALCLGLAAVGGFAGAAHTCKAQPGSCLEAWKAAGVGALAAATTGGTLLAQLDSRQGRPPEDSLPLPQDRQGEP